MTPEEFLKSQASGEAKAFAQNLIAQRDDTLTRIEQAETERKKLLDDHAAEIVKVTAEKDKEITSRSERLAEMEAYVNAVADLPIAKKLANEKRRAELKAALAELEAA